MKLYVIEEGRVFSEGPDICLPDLITVGREWIVVVAISEKDAYYQADLYDSRVHPRQSEMIKTFEKVRNLEDKELAKSIILSELYPDPPDVGSIVIEIEAIGYTAFRAKYNYSPTRYWVAEIVGPDPKWKFKRKFINGKRDFTKANRRASRGVYFYYVLSSNKIYEVSNPISNNHTDRYFCRIEDEQEIRMSEQEVLNWLKEV